MLDRRHASFPQWPEWKAEGRSGTPTLAYFGPNRHSEAPGLHPENFPANCVMASVKSVAAAVATILVREGVDYAQSKAVFKAARERAGLRATPEHRGGVDRLTVEEELRFLDRAYAQDGRTGLMLQTLLETGARASELVLLRVEDVSLVERVIIIRQCRVAENEWKSARSSLLLPLMPELSSQGFRILRQYPEFRAG